MKPLAIEHPVRAVAPEGSIGCDVCRTYDRACGIALLTLPQWPFPFGMCRDCAELVVGGLNGAILLDAERQ